MKGREDDRQRPSKTPPRHRAGDHRAVPGGGASGDRGIVLVSHRLDALGVRRGDAGRVRLARLADVGRDARGPVVTIDDPAVLERQVAYLDRLRALGRPQRNLGYVVCLVGVLMVVIARFRLGGEPWALWGGAAIIAI